MTQLATAAVQAPGDRGGGRKLTAEQQAMVAANLGLAGSAARPFARYGRYHDAQDMRGEAFLGLCRAAMKFDPNRANPDGVGTTRFSTYGTIMAKGAVYAYLKGRRAGKHALLDASERGDLASLVASRDETTDDDPGAPDRLGMIAAAIDRLHPRLAGIVRARLEGKTQAAIGREIGICKERVRQLELQAHDRLRRLVRGGAE